MGLFNHDIPLSPKGYDYQDQAYKNHQYGGFKGVSIGSEQRTIVGETMTSVDHIKNSNEKPLLVSPEQASGSVHILKSSQIGVDSDFTHSVDIQSPNLAHHSHNRSIGGYKAEVTTHSIDLIHQKWHEQQKQPRVQNNNRRQPQKLMFDAETNTHLKMKDLDLLVGVKALTKNTIATLEKIHDSSLDFSSF